MLFTKGLIKLFVLNLRLFNVFGSYLYKINPATYKLKFNNSKSLKFELLFKSAIALSMYTVVAVQLIAFRDIVPSVQLYEGIFFISLTLGYLGSLYEYYSRSTQVVELFNSLVQLEQQLSRCKYFNMNVNRQLFAKILLNEPIVF